MGSTGVNFPSNSEKKSTIKGSMLARTSSFVGHFLGISTQTLPYVSYCVIRLQEYKHYSCKYPIDCNRLLEQGLLN